MYQALVDGRSALSAAGEEGAAAAAAGADALALPGSTGAQLLAEVEAALRDDLNTPAAVAALSGTLKALNDLLTTKKVR